MNDRGPVVVVPAFEHEHPAELRRRAGLLKKHLHERGQQDAQINDLLADGLPRVDARDHQEIEDEAADKEGDGETFFVLLVHFAQALEASGSQCLCGCVHRGTSAVRSFYSRLQRVTITNYTNYTNYKNASVRRPEGIRYWTFVGEPYILGPCVQESGN
ncbi:MAG: hypothetical protein HC902_08040 [Calothrix sp. SM1_5_4]|nr:hypothetical protein [Calothrix sp. SM1_5_4]